MQSPTLAGVRGVLCLLALLGLLLSLLTPAARAEDSAIVVDPHPIKPAGTSSPRATLRSFLVNTHDAIERWREGGSAVGDPALSRAVATLDLSTTPNGSTWRVRAERVLLLKEILDRIALPPDDAIPGAREVAEENITQWTLPDTSIRIVRLTDGPKQGEFLFSADTVQQLGRLYRYTRHMPYKPGASAGIYEEIIRSDRSVLVQQSLVRNILKPVDTSNPRATLLGFLDSVNRAHALVMDADAALRAEPPTMTRAEAREVEFRATNLLGRAMVTLDLSQVPDALREDVGIETVLELKEVLDRMLLPPIDTVPDAQAVQAARESGERPFRWRYPNTEIEIVEITEGERQGQFLFSASTVSRSEAFYRDIQSLPYRGTDLGHLRLDYSSPGTSEGFFNYYISTPGYLVPRAHLFSSMVSGLPEWFSTLYHRQTVWQWMALVLSLLVVVFVAFVAFRLSRRVAARLEAPHDEWLKLMPVVIVASLIFVIIPFLDQHINLTGDVLTAVTTYGRVLVLALAAWAAFRLCTAVAETIIASPRVREQSVDASLVRIGALIVGFFLGAFILVDGVQKLGVNVIPLIAGLGVGGLAVALAAQSTIANFIGSLILFANRPVRVGDFCRYGADKIGTVEEIGLHSTRLRSLERTVITIPNAEFAQMQLENFALRDRRMFRTTLQLRYETTPEQLRYVLARLRELLMAHPKVLPEPARVRFVALGACSLDLEIFAYFDCTDQNEFLAIQEDVYLRIIDIVQEAGTGFAFPSQTTYFTRDTGLAEDLARAAETQVAAWREQGKLPFPEFADEQRTQMENRLDYPPVGSPDHKPAKG